MTSGLDAVGETPTVALDRLTRNHDGRFFAKLDYLNPGHSRKDRIALSIINAAERAGDLRPGQTVVEQTSGNTGTEAAIVCAVKGYPLVAVMSAGNSSERARMMHALGAEVVIVPQVSRNRLRTSRSLTVRGGNHLRNSRLAILRRPRLNHKMARLHFHIRIRQSYGAAPRRLLHFGRAVWRNRDIAANVAGSS